MSDQAREILKAVLDSIPAFILREHTVVDEVRPGVIDPNPILQTFPRFLGEVKKAREFLDSPSGDHGE